MIETIDQLQDALRNQLYVADRGLATAIFLALKLERPLFLEGEAGVGKTEVAKVITRLLDTELIRLQCYEGLDVSQAVYEWNYTRQIMHIRLHEARGDQLEEAELFGPEFLLKRPLLQAIESSREKPAVLLIDEVDRSDEEFEAFLLEVLSDFQITIPEIGTIRAGQPPVRPSDLQPHARAARCAQAALPLLLDRLPLFPERAGHRARQGTGRFRRAGAAGDRLHPGAARHRSVQDPGRCRNAGLDCGAGGAGSAGARSGHHRGYAGRHPQVPG